MVNRTRRAALKSLGALGGLTLCLKSSGSIAASAGLYGAEAQAGGTVDNPLVFLSLHPDGSVTLLVSRPEMGQGVRSSFARVVADELDADLSRVKVQQAPGDEARYGSQNTDGSRSMRHFFAPMRRVGAAARMMLESAAAARWGVPVAQVAADRHAVVHTPSGRKLGYGELAQEAMRQSVPAREKLRLKHPDKFRYIGRPDADVIDGADILSGRAIYGIDIAPDGLLHAVIARPPARGVRATRFDADAARAIPGVIDVIELDASAPPPAFNPLGGVAVVARDTWSATRGRDALNIVWSATPDPFDSASYERELTAAAREPSQAVRNQGDALRALSQAQHRISAEYTIPHLAHASMEPPAATAIVRDGRCEAWACVQAPQEARELLAHRLGLKFEDVTMHVTLLGGGFGRKSMPDFVAEAALLSKAMQGAPVKVTWMREDDLQHDYYHAISMQRLESALDEHGRPVAWLHRSAAPTLRATFAADAKRQSGGEYGQTAIGIPYQIPNIRLEIPDVAARTRLGWLRSVSNIPHAFAVQSFVSELAAAAHRDPKDYLLELIGPPRRIDPRSQSDHWNYGESPEAYPIDTARLRHVIELAASEAHWGAPLPRGHGRGVAATYSFLTYAAAVVEVRMDDRGRLEIPRVDIAFDCGPQINPDRVRAQVEGSCIMGLSLALTGEITFKGGAVEQSNFHDYPILRIHESPRELRVHMVPGDFSMPLGGVGEPALPPIAPALCNAIHAATGRRIRRLPIFRAARSNELRS